MRSAFLLRCGAVFMLVAGTGCLGGVSLRPVQTDVSFRKLQGNTLSTDGLSESTAQLLRTFDLDATYRKDTTHALLELRDEACGRHDRQVLFGLAELACYAGKRADKKSPEQALAYYYSACRYAYFYLFSDEFGSLPDPFDPRFRLACDVYNFSLARCIRLMQQDGQDLSDTATITLWDGSMEVNVSRLGFLPEEDIDRLLLATDYEVEGVRNQYRTFGLGVPLIAVGNTPPKGSHLPDTPSYPATAFLRMEGNPCEDLYGPRKATLELYDSIHTQTVEVAGRQAPLESDITTPLGFLLANPGLERAAYIGLLRAEKVDNHTGLYMLEPYQPGKIPVVMVHGLVSSPLTWAEMLNDLRGQPEIRDRYQFWFYLYPTGYPFIYSASQLRESLLEVRKTFDPQGTDAAFDEMVLVGHSMGGLISDTLVKSGGIPLWNAISTKPLDELKVTPEEQALIDRVFFFEPLPFVKRVVFIATPHRGSTLSYGVIGTLVSLVMAVPKAILTQMVDFVDRNPDALRGGLRKRRLTSVDNLSPGNPIIQALQEIPYAPGVIYHTIMGNNEDDPEKEPSDGVVANSSSHVDGAASEKVVPYGHSCHEHPLAILEVRRILLEHLQAVERD
ncbi:MAG: alpha/beta hydrolase [Candidatus Hydrogenedentes bacterium]|nr:alpha/beta hydrolase [Candidatus Hydrogenedentota bacterium]